MIRIGIVGIGGMGSVHHNNYAEIDGCKVAAVISNSVSGRKKAGKWGLPVYKNIDSMVQVEEIDVIDICTPTFLHKQQVMKSLSLGKHVIVEKPIALHKEDAEDMFNLAEEKGLLLFVGQVLQFTKAAEILHQIIENGEFGKPLDGYFERITGSPGWAQGGWLFDKDKSGLLPFDLHIHDLDLIVSLFGKPDEYNFTSCGRKDRKFQEQYRFNYKYGKLNIVAEAAWYNADYPFTTRWRIYFENALVVFDGKNLILYQSEREPYYFDIEDEIKIPTGINLPSTGMFYYELSHFLSCIKQGIPSEKVSESQVITVVEILEEILNHNQE
ncbi:MAG: Gfo/Idh/MocA family oxidoreductase [Firmicutes bacterium]|nr:Gfo/Idh/MocA family oxidoreductase [Bacillota bacterium]